MVTHRSMEPGKLSCDLGSCFPATMPSSGKGAQVVGGWPDSCFCQDPVIFRAILSFLYFQEFLMINV